MNNDEQVIKFYFDPISPYAWLAVRQLDNLATKINKPFSIRPVLFAGLLQAHETKGPAEIPAKRRYIFRDVMRRAAMQGIRFAGPPSHPFNPLVALRLATAIDDERTRLGFCLAIADAAWEQGKDISVMSTVIDVAASLGLEEKWVSETVQNPVVKEKLKTQTAAAVALGVFGVPSYMDGDELFWGNEANDVLIWFNQGNRIDDKKYAQALSRPASVVRRV